MIISPSILSADFLNLEHDIEKFQNLGATWFHLDIMDGHFVPNISFGIPVVKSIRKNKDIFLDTHLMIENPEKYIESFVLAGSDLITFHYEATKENTLEVIKLIKSFGKKVGLSIKPKTRPEEIFEFLPYLDLVLVMTVEPGFGGQEFMQDCALKIKVFDEFKKQNNLNNLIIQIDGGINEKTAKICAEYGANSLVAGNYLFLAENPKDAYKKILI
ncbi:ribulose-phosphate 3-epimerase [bacterium]|nr:ribulose-phosphate 3-epimerase [bacterium]